MKTYQAPKLSERGNVVEITLGIWMGKNDPDAGQQISAPGSAGFNL
jgi:hypothetical protein